MKKILIFLLSIAISLILAACTQDKEDSADLEEDKNNTEKTTDTNESMNDEDIKVDEEAKVDEGMEDQVTEKEITKKEDVNKTGTEKEEETPKDQGLIKQEIEDSIYKADAFKDVKIKEQNDVVVVNGKARVYEGVFQYAVVKDGENIKEDHYQTAGAPEWGEFEFTINKNILDESDINLELFSYSAKDGSKQDVLKIPLTS